MYIYTQKYIFCILKHLTLVPSKSILFTRHLSDFVIKNKLINCCTAHIIKGVRQWSEMANEKPGLPLREIVGRLDHYAPKHLAEAWDNVGLLIQPSIDRIIKKIILTNDLTEEVMDEVLDMKADFIITYHPLIFTPLKSITEKSWKERIIAKCLENRIAVYSPHTSFDVIKGGVNDWLASAFDTHSVEPLAQRYAPDASSETHLVEMVLPIKSLEEVLEKASKEIKLATDLKTEVLPSGQTKVVVPCSKSSLPILMQICHSQILNDGSSSFRILKCEDVPIPGVGVGRLCLLKKPLQIKAIVEMMKKHIGKSHLKLALAVKKTLDATVSSIAICAGSGSSVLRGVSADLYLTGEMLHHDILDATHRGSHVILCNHSDSERGFLREFSNTLSTQLLEQKVEVVVSKNDRDPLIIL